MSLARSVDHGGILREVSPTCAGVLSEPWIGAQVAVPCHHPRHLPFYLLTLLAREDGKLVLPSPDSWTDVGPESLE